MESSAVDGDLVLSQILTRSHVKRHCADVAIPLFAILLFNRPASGKIHADFAGLKILRDFQCFIDRVNIVLATSQRHGGISMSTHPVRIQSPVTVANVRGESQRFDGCRRFLHAGG